MTSHVARLARSWKFWAAVFCLFLLLLGTSTLFAVRALATALDATTRAGPGGFGGQEDALDRVTQCCRFELAEWETQQLLRWAVGYLFLPPPGNAGSGDLDLVRRFFALAGNRAAAEYAMNRAESPEQRRAHLQELERLTSQREAIRLRVERVMGALVAQRIAQEGLAPTVPLRDNLLLPPVAFTIQRPPSVLVISPRDRIALERTTVLEPGLREEQVLRLEGGAAEQGWSAVVEPTGGYSTYPTIIGDGTSLSFALQAIAHEWSHTYLFFRPLGFNYFDSAEMRTINETVADIVGREVGRAVMEEHFVQPIPRPALPSPEPGFDFRKEMRETRLEAERLLAAGKTAGAEAYMEQRRKLFVDNGYNIRKLNQAYFAFHGTYADSPGSVSPIGPQLAQLFQRAGSLGRFLKTVEGVRSTADFRRLLERFGIEEAP